VKFDKAKDPAACAAKEETRYAVHGVAVVRKGDETYLAATDGRSLSMVRAFPEDGDDVPPDGDVGSVYPPVAFAAARKACKRAPDASLSLNGSARVTADGAVSEYAKLASLFPDVLGVVPKAKPVHVLRLNAEYLARLQEAFGANGVEIQVHATDPGTGALAHDLPLTIRPLYVGKDLGAAKSPDGSDDGSFGVLMPIARV
jgi:hypothetical protein